MTEEVINILVALVKAFEGFSATPYLCPAGVLTIGYGETLGVKEGMIWTRECAESRLRIRLRGYLLATLNKCPQLLFEPPMRVAACVSLSYNIGVSAFSASSVSRYTKLRRYKAAGDSFLLWNKSHGRVLRGLSLRRAAERIKYLLQ